VGTLAAANYTFSFVNGTLTVTKATLTVTADNKSKVYGAPNPGLTASYSGFKNGETLATSGVNGSPALTTTATAASPTGTYPVAAAVGNLTSVNYSFTFVSGSLYITPATLTITADNKTKQYGDPNPTLTYTTTGFVNGDSASAITGSPSLSTTATLTSVPNTYPITVGVGTLTAANYTFSFASGTLTVVARQAPVAYIGQTYFYTSGSSSTNAQVTLSASIQDTTGSGADLSKATVTFTDLLTNKVLASNVPVTKVLGSTVPTGTANTIVTLSSGQYGAASYLIQVTLSGGVFQNCQQTGAYGTACQTGYPAPGGTNPWPVPSSTDPAYMAAHPVVNVLVPTTPFTMQGVLGLPGIPTSGAAPAGKYGGVAAVGTYSVGMQFNNKLTNPQGQILLMLQQGDGTYYVKSNSITSITFSGPCNKDLTIYTKASIYKVNNAGASTSVDGNVTLRLDSHDGNQTTGSTCTPASGDTIGFTVLSSKTGELYYSNNWVYDSAIKGWHTVQQLVPTSGGTAAVIG
jgi:hypothetical protein